MPESYMQATIVWPVIGQSTHRETRIGRADAAGVMIWGEWRLLDLAGLTGNQPPAETVRNYHGKKIAAEVRDLNGSSVGESIAIEHMLVDNTVPANPGVTGIIKENQPNNTVKVTFNFAPPVDWQLVTNRRVKIIKITLSGEFVEHHGIEDALETQKIVTGPVQQTSQGYVGHRIEVSFIDNHSNESGVTVNTYDMLSEGNVPLKPAAPTLNGFVQVPGPEFGGQV